MPLSLNGGNRTHRIVPRVHNNINKRVQLPYGFHYSQQYDVGNQCGLHVHVYMYVHRLCKLIVSHRSVQLLYYVLHHRLNQSVVK